MPSRLSIKRPKRKVIHKPNFHHRLKLGVKNPSQTKIAAINPTRMILPIDLKRSKPLALAPLLKTGNVVDGAGGATFVEVAGGGGFGGVDGLETGGGGGGL